MRREARIGFAIVGCLAAVLTYAAVKRLWLLAQVARNPDPAPTIPGEMSGAPSALLARNVPPVITLPSEPTEILVYQEPEAQTPVAAPASRFTIPLPSRETAETPAADVAVAPTTEPAVDSTPVEAAPPLGKFSSRFSAAPQPESSRPNSVEVAEPTAPAKPDPISAMASRFSLNATPPTAAEESAEEAQPSAIPSVSSLVGSLASSLATRMTGGRTDDAEEAAAEPEAAPQRPVVTILPQPQQVAETAQPADEPQASLRIVGEKGREAEPEVPPTAQLIKPSPLVEAQPVPKPTAPVVTAAPRDTPKSSRPTWQLSSAPSQPKTEVTAETSPAQPKPQPRLNRAFASTADATPAKYVPAQNASTTQTLRDATPQYSPPIDDKPRRLPPTIEVSGGAEQGITKQADPAWVQQMIESGSFIPGQRFVPTQTPQPLPIERQAMQPLSNSPAPQQPSTVPPLGTAPPHTYVVQPGDDLATIARRTLGDAARWGELFRLNRDLIGDYPDQMKPGTRLRLPE